MSKSTRDLYEWCQVLDPFHKLQCYRTKDHKGEHEVTYRVDDGVVTIYWREPFVETD